MSSFVATIAIIGSATLITANAFAATDSVATSKSTKSASEQIAELNGLVKNRLRIGATVNTASKMEGLSFKNNGATQATGEANTDNTPALELTWVGRLYEDPDATKFDWFAGLTIERERTVSSLNLKAVGAGRPAQTFTMAESSRPTFHSNLLSAGIRWTPNSTLYIPLGFNYGFRPEATGTKDLNFNLDPAIGVMVGAGLRLNPQIEVEAVYKVVRYDFSLRPTNRADKEELVGLVDLSGVSVGARYVF
jgi:hypothetical protein